MYKGKLLNATPKTASAFRLQSVLLNYHDFRQRSRNHPLRAQVKQVAQWQSERLKGTHADLYSQARYHAGLDFLLQDLYSPRDFYQRDDDIDRIFPKLIKLMPDSILDLVSSLVELNHLTQKMDQQLAEVLTRQSADFEITETAYLKAYPLSASHKERLHQIQLIANIGDDLEKYTRSHFLLISLKMARKPAEMAGLGALHDFLCRGFEAFNTMSSVGDLLDQIVQRETRILTQIFDRHPQAFCIKDSGVIDQPIKMVMD